MLQPTLLVGTAFSFASGVIYYIVGRSLGRRRFSSTDAHLAWNLFILWWYALAGNSLTSGALSLLGGLGITNLPIFLTFTQANLLSACAALYGLMYYLLYLFTGNRKVLPPLTIFYILYYLLLTYYFNWSIPLRVDVGKWSAQLVYQNQQAGFLYAFAFVLLVCPQIFGSLAYFTLFFRAREITQKYRIALVSGSIFIVFVGPVLASIFRWSQYDWWQIAGRLIGLGATATILLAYWPMRWIKQRFGVTSIVEDDPSTNREYEVIPRSNS
ncbi:MAG: hypothetical protein M1281_20620 [Chloroflexi bacterium]|nr:hypothetical protein [Chloroflexota bacterium]